MNKTQFKLLEKLNSIINSIAEYTGSYEDRLNNKYYNRLVTLADNLAHQLSKLCQ